MKEEHVDSSKKIEIKGWINEDEDKPKSNIPVYCPKCGKKLSYTNALQTCGIYFIFCINLKCRYAEEYRE